MGPGGQLAQEKKEKEKRMDEEESEQICSWLLDVGCVACVSLCVL